MLKNMTAGTKNFTITLFNRIWRDTDFPQIWDNATVLPFSKPGKDSTIPSNYRPIALTSHLVKLFEKVVLCKLVAFMDHHELFNPSQHGFRGGPY